MVNYSNGKIYVIRNTVNNKLYVGSTIDTLSQRLSNHKRSSYAKNMAIGLAFQQIGFNNFYIELVENYPCNNRQELKAREGYWIRHFQTHTEGYNKYIAGRTKDEYNKDNREKIRERHNEVNKDVRWKQLTVSRNTDEYRQKMKEYLKNYRAINKDTLSKKHKLIYQTNKEAIMKRMKEKITCACGSIINRGGIAEHNKSKKHLHFLSKHESV